jgi:hypothetical protein
MALPGAPARRIHDAIELHHERDNIFRIECRNKLRQAEFKRCQEQILHEVSRVGPVRLLFAARRVRRVGLARTSGVISVSSCITATRSSALRLLGEERWRDLALIVRRSRFSAERR